jgi:hypothetical protein
MSARSSAAGRVRFVSVRHAGTGRSIAVLDPETLRDYTRLVAEVAPAVEAGLSVRVLANRVATCSVDPPLVRLRPWRTERGVFASRLSELAGSGATLAFADVRRCYGSISPPRVAAGLRRFGVGTARAIEGFLDGLGPDGVEGLPIGPAPSAVLANAVLDHVDRALERADIVHVRWVDDLVLASADPRRALDMLRGALEEIGLRLNERKTRVVRDVDRRNLGLGIGSPTAGRALRLAGVMARG